MPDAVEESDEVLYTTAALVTVSGADIAALKKRAAKTRRRRCRLCVHPDANAALHGMIIVHGRDAYVRPHKHIGKSESFHVIEGSALMVVFDDHGNITRTLALGDAASGRCFYYRMPEDVFHMLVITSDWLVFHESTSGPFDRAKTVLAPWAPADGDDAEVAQYMAGIRETADREPAKL